MWCDSEVPWNYFVFSFTGLFCKKDYIYKRYTLWRRSYPQVTVPIDAISVYHPNIICSYDNPGFFLNKKVKPLTLKNSGKLSKRRPHNTFYIHPNESSLGLCAVMLFWLAGNWWRKSPIFNQRNWLLRRFEILRNVIASSAAVLTDFSGLANEIVGKDCTFPKIFTLPLQILFP